ncbi:hypothetical protein F4779DRAFT_582140 [Xylariaceae sp. FL0662B]|nr:hypothetical protein F4779DRAFT_582140 [Xylariaceae sp. FL0662B]
MANKPCHRLSRQIRGDNYFCFCYVQFSFPFSFRFACALVPLAPRLSGILYVHPYTHTYIPTWIHIPFLAFQHI